MKPASSEEISEIKATLSRIETALVGDQAMGHVGLVDRVADHDMRIVSIEQQRRDDTAQRRGATWVVATIGMVGGVVGGLVTWLIEVATALRKL